MTDAEIGCLRERADERAWEELNKQDPHARAAADLCNKAKQFVMDAVGYLGKAAEEVEHLPETDMIAMFANELENLACDIGAQAKSLGG